ncbi:MAG TPA: hypothetical protein VGL92_05420 [Acidimicrobiia bacterium]|jgi:hypothetical protein
MPAAVALSALAVALAVVALARVAVALDAVEFNLRSTITTIRTLHRALREAGALAQAVGRDAAAGEATLGRLETLKARGGGDEPPVG